MRSLLVSACLIHSAQSGGWHSHQIEHIANASQLKLAQLLKIFIPMHALNVALSTRKLTGHVRLLGSPCSTRGVAPAMADTSSKTAEVKAQGPGQSSQARKPKSSPSVLIMGTGLTGSLTCYHLRALLGESVRIDVKDMARGVGGRMTTTRRGPQGMKANVGAQYVSFFSPEAAATLKNACGVDDSTHECPVDRVPKPLRRSTHFLLKPRAEYEHFLPRHGTNSVLKQFLYGGKPDQVSFESRLQRIAVAESGKQFLPLFDQGDASKSLYDIVVLAMPPKDILKFFSDRPQDHDGQSQADLHRRTNEGKKSVPVPRGHRSVVLPAEVTSRLRKPSYIGRYSLALWFKDKKFIRKVWDGWTALQKPHEVIDAISPQDNAIVVQSTVKLWKRARGRGYARSALDAALEALAGEKMPRAQFAKLLNWRTSQVERALPRDIGSNAVQDGDVGVVTAENGRLIFTGDWCAESSFEGCNLAAMKAATTAKDAIAEILTNKDT